MTGLSFRTTMRAVLIGAWAAFFLYLWLTGEQARYIGPRTLWVIPFGSITLSLAAIAHLFFLRGRDHHPVRRSELLGTVVALLPIVALLMAPAPELGSLAASRKAGTTGLATQIALAPSGGSDRELSFIDIHYANLSENYAIESGIAQGRPMELTGFVSGAEDNGLKLTCFYISCCAADAIPFSVTVLPPGGEEYPNDTWLAVEGEIVVQNERYVLQADTMEEVPTPKTPYLS